jgi:hypothetical protein
VTTGTGLTAYDLQAPAKNLYPVNTPIRNSLPRTPGIGPATNWRAVTGITGSGFDAMGWVPEGQRAGAMSITVSLRKSASYRTLGDEEAITYEAVNAARGYEDIRATSTVRFCRRSCSKKKTALSAVMLQSPRYGCYPDPLGGWHRRDPARPDLLGHCGGYDLRGL